jgi:hypothetical protein
MRISRFHNQKIKGIHQKRKEKGEKKKEKSGRHFPRKKRERGNRLTGAMTSLLNQIGG